MESQREVERKYKKLLKDVATEEFYTKVDLTNRVNCYSCKCGHITKTIDIDSGVTPFYFSCDKCGEMATSSFYKDIAPSQLPTHEWYRPTLKQVLKMRRIVWEGLLDHVLQGGLDSRKIVSPPNP